MIVVRAVTLELGEESVHYSASSGSGLDRWLGRQGAGGRVAVRLHLMRARRLGLLVQRLPSERVEAIWEPVLRIERVGTAICRFHDGPWGEPEKHRYCTRRAVTREGYCELHRRSWRALYEKCAQGVDSACMSVAPLLRGREFAVYVLDYGGSVAKAGLTQGWRVLWRAAEQPHVSLAVVFRGELLEARELEKRLGRSPAATEGAAARINRRIESAVSMLRRGLERPERLAERLAALLERLGLRGEYEAYTVLPRSKVPEWVRGSRRLGLSDIVGRTIRVRDYWAGYLLVEDGGGRGVIHKSEIQHLELAGTVAPER